MPEGAELDRLVDSASAKFKQWQGQKVKLHDDFVADIQTVLSDEQTAQWAALERKLYRQKKLDSGELSGENVDLFDVVREMHLSPDAAAKVDPVLAEYDVAINEALKRRTAYLSESAADMMAAFMKRDFDKLRPSMEQMTKLHVAVRDVNEQYLESIAAQLAEPDAAKFRIVARERGFQNVYRETRAQRAVSAAKKLQDLSPETKEAIASLEQSMNADLSAKNAELVVLTKKYQPEQQRQMADRMALRMNGGGGRGNNQNGNNQDDPLSKAMQSKRDASEKYVEQLKSLLTPEQFASLPQDDAPRGGRGGGNRGNGGGNGGNRGGG